MRPIIVATIIITTLLAVNTIPLTAQTPEQLFQKGLTKEEGEGALNDAINLYNQVADNSNATASLRAKALMHIGMCYEKLGIREAVKAYQRLVANFPNQKNEVTYAKERLTQLAPLTGGKPEANLLPKFKKIKMPTNTDNALLSPDGKRIAFVLDGCVWTIPVSGGVDLYIAGEPKKLTDNIGAWDTNNSLAWSGDGKWIAVNAELKSNSTSVYIIPSDGGIPRKVKIPSHQGDWPSTFRLSLSPDGKILAYATASKTGDYEASNAQIFTIPVNGEIPRELTGPGTQEPAFSPDGSKIAYMKLYRNNNGRSYIPNSELWVIPSEGGTPIQITNLQSGQLFGPTWSPDGRMITFIRRPGIAEPNEIWVVPVTDKGALSAAPTKIDLPQPSYHEVAGWTPDKKIGVMLMNPEYETIYTVNSSGGIATQVTPQGWTSYPKWSPDGKKIFFRGSRGKIVFVPSGGGTIDSIPIESEFDMSTAVPGSGNDISPDGKTIVFSGARIFIKDGKKKFDVNIFTIPVEGGKPKQLTTINVELQDRFPCWSPDGNSIAFIRPEIKNGKYIMHIFTISKEGTNLRQITSESDNVAWAPVDWAPDGKSITYFSNDNTIRFIPFDGGESRFLIKVDSANRQNDLAWSPDGKELAYTDKGKLRIYSNESGKSKEVKTGVAASATKLGWSPDGKKIAFTAFAGGDYELWLMEDFLPLEKLAQNKVTQVPLTPKFTKIKIPTKIGWSVRLSPNGKILGLVSDEKIWKMPLSGNIGPDFPGAPVLLNTDGIPVEYTDLSWSNDGKWIAFNDPGLTGPNQRIYIVPSEGGKPEKIIENFRDARVVNYRISLSPNGENLAFSSVEEKKQHIYTIPTNGGNPVRLTDMQAREPAFSPDGKLIAFVEDKNLGAGQGGLGLWIIPASGGTPQLLAEAGTASSPVWSPNGSFIAFLDFSQEGLFFGKQINIVPVLKGEKIPGNVTRIDVPNGVGDVRKLAGWTPDNKIGALCRTKQEFALYTLPAKGGQASIILPDCYTLQPRFSHNGKQIYFTTPPVEGDNKFYRLLLASVPAIGGTGTPLPNNEIAKNIHSLSYQGGNRVSPDGNWIASSTWSSADTSSEIHFPRARIWKMAVDGSKSIQITKTQGQYADLCPSWSPDGKKIAFKRTKLQSGMEPFNEDYGIYIIDSSGGEPDLLTSIKDKIIYSPVWSPDGTMIAYLTGEPPTLRSNPTMNVVNVSTGESKVIGKVPAVNVNIELAWSPDSKRIAFNGDNLIKVINVDDGKIEDIETNLVDVDIWHLDWSPDGEQFVFSGVKGGKDEFWFLENFLPLEKLAQKK